MTFLLLVFSRQDEGFRPKFRMDGLASEIGRFNIGPMHGSRKAKHSQTNLHIPHKQQPGQTSVDTGLYMWRSRRNLHVEREEYV